MSLTLLQHLQTAVQMLVHATDVKKRWILWLLCRPTQVLVGSSDHDDHFFKGAFAAVTIGAQMLAFATKVERGDNGWSRRC